MAITQRLPTKRLSCTCCGAPFRTFAGQLDLDGSKPLFVIELREHDDERTVWTAFVIGPWNQTDQTQGSWISICTRIKGENVVSSITDPVDSPLRDSQFIPPIPGITRADVFARPGAPEYFFRAIDIVNRDKEIFEFLTSQFPTGRS
jgi:hypothetical protein